jgi:hypothetical protein
MKGPKMAFRFIAVSAIAAVFVLTAGTAIHAGDEASREFKGIMQSIQHAGKSGSPYQFVDTAEKLLYPFIEKHPGTKEAASAHFALGQVYSNIQRNDEAVKHLTLYLQADIPLWRTSIRPRLSTRRFSAEPAASTAAYPARPPRSWQGSERSEG